MKGDKSYVNNFIYNSSNLRLLKYTIYLTERRRNISNICGLEHIKMCLIVSIKCTLKLSTSLFIEQLQPNKIL